MNIEAIIEKFKSRPGFRELPVRNFLGSLGNSTQQDALSNLTMDARSYGWKPSIVAAIKAGIIAKFKPRTKQLPGTAPHDSGTAGRDY